MRLSARLCAALAALAGCAPVDPVVEDPRFTELKGWTVARMEEWAIPGAAIAVVEDGRLQHVAGLGVRQQGEIAPVTPQTRFRVGSISKMITGILAADLAAAGEIDLDAPASGRLGDLALAGGASFEDVTYLQLVSHLSGMQTTGLPRECETDPRALRPTLAGLTPQWALWTPPGALYNYSNQNYSLAGLAVERAGGDTFSAQAQRLFDRAGMRATYDWEEAAAGDHAVGHTMDTETGEVLEYRGLEERACVASYPSGGLMASAEDLGRLLEILVAEGEGWLSPEGWRILTREGYARTETSGYGFGLANTDYAGFPSLTHHGTVGGYFAMVWAIPSEGLGIAVLVNVSHYVTDPPTPWSKPTHRIMRRALDVFLGVDEEDDIAPTLRPPEDWDRFAGVYRSAYELGEVAVTRSGDTLWYEGEGGDLVTQLLPYSADTFLYADPDDEGDYISVSFEYGEDGQVAWLITESGVAARRPFGDPPGRGSDL